LTTDREVEYPELNSNHDETDTGLIVQAHDAFHSQHNLVVIRTVDTDVLVLAVHHLEQVMENNSQQLLLLMGMGKYKRYVSATATASNLPGNLRGNLLAMHALIGCDSTSSIFRISKQKAVEVMSKAEFSLQALGSLDWCGIADSLYKECERYVCKLYGEHESLTEARYNLLATKQLAESQLPPSSNALKYHIQRASYQISIWKSALSPVMDVPPAKDHGWTPELLRYHCDKSPTHTLLISACGCKKACDSNICKCRKNKLLCTDARSCNKTCCLNYALDSDAEDVSEINSSDEE
jgi:hypothetical protein